MQIKIPEDVRYIIGVLENAGYEAYAVGGCIRDSLLGRTPKDWDITTSADPSTVKGLFRRTIDTGIKHGTVTIMLKSTGYEVTTYRIDGKYDDHRRPDSVEFTSELSEDLLRRDFTINAMAFNEKKGLVDLYGGEEDLANHIIRCVGDPYERFDEDALRIMRAVRFAAELNFEIEENTRKAAQKLAPFLKEISAERVENELTKLIMSDHPEKLIDACEMGITRMILPEFDEMLKTPQNNPYHIFDVGRHTIEVIKNIPKSKVLRYTALLHDVGKPACKTTDENGTDHFKGHNAAGEKIAEKVLRRLKMDNDTIRDVKKLVYWHDYGIKGDIKLTTFRKGLSKMGIEYFDDVILIKKADIAGQNPEFTEKSIANLEHLIEMKEQIVKENNCLKIADLQVNGKDLMELGIKQGPALGETLSLLLDRVLEQPELNSREKLLSMVREMLVNKE